MSSDHIITQALESESDSEILQLTLTPPDNIPRQAATALNVASVLLTHLSSDLLQTQTDIETNLINMVTPGHPLATQFAAAYHLVKKRDHGREYGAYEELRAAAQSGDVRQGEDDDDEYKSPSPPRRRQHGATIAASSSTRKRRSSTLSTTSSRHVRQRTIVGALPSPPLPRALQPAFADPTSDSESEQPWEPIAIQRSRVAAAAATTSPWSPIRRASSTSPTPTTPSSTDTINMDIVSSPSGSTPVNDPYSFDSSCSCFSSSPSPDKKTQEEEIPTPPRAGATTTTTTASETIQSTTHLTASTSSHIPPIDILDDDELESKYDDV